MTHRSVVEFDGQDIDCTIAETDGGRVAITLRHEACQITVGLDLESAWELTDALAKAVSRAAVSRAQAKEAAK